MRKEAPADGGVTYIGPRSFIAGFAVVCAVFLAIVCGATRFAGSLEPPLSPDRPTLLVVSAPAASVTAPAASASAPAASGIAAATPVARVKLATHRVLKHPPVKPRIRALTWLEVEVLRSIPAPVLGLFHLRVNPVWIARASGRGALERPPSAGAKVKP